MGVFDWSDRNYMDKLFDKIGHILKLGLSWLNRQASARFKELSVNGIALFLTFNIASGAILPGMDLIPANETLIQRSSLEIVQAPNLPRKKTVVITAYSSTPDQTDDTPFITASGTHVRDGVIAANFLKFGTIVMIPDLFGDKKFVVEDRMNARYNPENSGNYYIDIWFPDRASARRFGLRKTEIVIL